MIGFSAVTGTPRDRSAATIAAASTVLPTPVSVPVTNSPRKRRRLRSPGLGRFEVEHVGTPARRLGNLDLDLCVVFEVVLGVALGHRLRARIEPGGTGRLTDDPGRAPELLL